MTFLDFFSGIGGFRLALERAGHTCLGHCEIDKYADRSYREMYEIKNNEWFGKDITKVDPAELPEADIYCGGFPCQSFSIAGRGKGFEDTRGTLIFEVLRLVKARKPKILLLENVKRLVTHDEGRTFQTILKGLCELGYSVEWQIFNSKNFGVPQNRERVFIVASLGGRCTGEVFPIIGADGASLIQLIGGSQNKRVYDIEGAAITLTAEGGGKGGKSGLYAVGNKPKKKFFDLCKNQPRTTDNARCIVANYNHGITNRNQSSGVLISENGAPMPVLTPNRETIRQNGPRFRNPEQEMFCLTGQDVHGVAYVKNATKQGYDVAREGDGIVLAFPDSESRRGRVGKGVSQTLDTGCQVGVLQKEPKIGGLYTNDSPDWHKSPLPELSRTLKAGSHDAGITDGFRIRKLTPKECWRLQGFPDELFYKAQKVNSDNQLYKQAGNSITVNVVYVIAKRLKELEPVILAA